MAKIQIKSEKLTQSIAIANAKHCNRQRKALAEKLTHDKNPEALGFAACHKQELFVAQELINKVKIKELRNLG